MLPNKRTKLTQKTNLKMDYSYLLAPLVAWLIAQLIKFAIHAFKGDIDLGKLYESGGMPSAHTALIVAVTTTIGVLEGGQSAIFGFALSIALIIVYDAVGVRRSSGLQAEAIRLLYRSESERNNLDLGMARGHTPSEIVGGASVGLLVGLLFTYEHSLAKLGFLLQPPQYEQVNYYLAIFALGTFAPLLIGKIRTRVGPHTTKINAGSLIWLVIVWLAGRSSVPIIGWKIAWFICALATWLVVAYLASRPPKPKKQRPRPTPPKRSKTKRHRKRRS